MASFTTNWIFPSFLGVSFLAASLVAAYCHGAFGSSQVEMLHPETIPRDADPPRSSAPKADTTKAQVVAPQAPEVRDEERTPSHWPDLVQSDPELKFPLEGSSYCGPVAASDAVLWLAEHGFPRLAPAADSPRVRHLLLAPQLAARQFMGTSPVGGTAPDGILEGLDRWVFKAGYRVKSLRYQGWRNHPSRFATGVRVPTPAFAAQALEAGGIALVHAGWYQPRAWDGAFLRHGGHWLAIARVNMTQNPPEMVVIDPAPYAGNTPEEVTVTVTPLDHGYLSEGNVNLAARGYSVLGGGMHVKRPTEVALMDGLVTLVLDAPESAPAPRSP